MKIKNTKEGGYTIIELLFYISLFIVSSILVINSMVVMSRSFRETALQVELLQGGSIMERMSREIRQSLAINTITASSLKLNTKDGSGVSKTVEFVLSGSNVRLLDNNVFIGNLNTPNMVVTTLSFTQINSTVSKAIKIDLSVRSGNDNLNRIFNFYDTIVLRGSY